MSASGLGLRRSTGERLAAWLVTGPVGHLVGFLADAAMMWAGWMRAEALRRRDRVPASRARESSR